MKHERRELQHEFISVLVNDIRAWVTAGRPSESPLPSPITGAKSCPSYPATRSGTPFSTRGASAHLGHPHDGHVHDDTGLPASRTFGPCVTQRCAYWTGHCNLGTRIASVNIRRTDPPPNQEAGATCPIRSTCRWLAENGPTVCTGCQLVEYHPF